MLTLVNVITIGSIGVALTTALAVFGQLVFSSLVDNFGLFGLTKYEFNPKKLVGLFYSFCWISYYDNGLKGGVIKC